MIGVRMVFASEVRSAAMVLLFVVAGLSSSLSAEARSDDADREFQAAEKKIHALLREAEELQEEGKPDRADALRRKAERLKDELREAEGRHELRLTDRRKAEIEERDVRREGDREERPARREREREERDRPRRDDEFGEILEGLERGIVALRSLGRHEEAERLQQIAKEVREKRGGRSDRERRGEEEGRRGNEREIAAHQTEIMMTALPALMEAGRKDTAEVLERAIRARKVARQGRRDAEALRIREQAPSRGQLVEILALSARLWREYGNEEKAAALGRLAEQMSPRRDRDREERRVESPERRGERPEQRDRDREEGRVERPEGRGGSEREIARRQLEVMRLALSALREADRKDAIELLERAIRAREVALEERRDDEAHRIRERAPSRRQLAEILSAASRLWREFGNQEKAAAIGRLAEQMQSRR